MNGFAGISSISSRATRGFFIDKYQLYVYLSAVSSFIASVFAV